MRRAISSGRPTRLAQSDAGVSGENAPAHQVSP